MQTSFALEQIRWTDRFVQALPEDPAPGNVPRQVMGAAYSRVTPTHVRDPRLIGYSREVAERLGLPVEPKEAPELAALLAGNRVVPGMVPYSACYGGHQFGNWAGQLGDGRAITLGEIVSPSGAVFELQLKGAGRTPYSRSADGRAVLRSSVREFLCSEAMHHLGVPTTRALSLVTTGDDVVRDMFYDGRAAPEPGAIVARVAPSFLRFGNYELPSARGDRALLDRLVAHTVTTFFPDVVRGGEPSSPEVVAELLAEVARRTAVLIAHWMRVGFVHGVMNTDNMSILGLTIDYGPYGWVEPFDPDFTPNTTDATGRRYRFGHQPDVALWNLARLAEALGPIVGSVAPLEEALRVYVQTFGEAHERTLAAKLGLSELREDDRPRVDRLFQLMNRDEIDFTLFFRALARVETIEDALPAPVEAAYYGLADVADANRREMLDWLRWYVKRTSEDGLTHFARRGAMDRVNPKFVFRNYLAQQAIDRAAEGDASEIDTLLEVLRRPYDEQPEHERFAQKRPEWARNRAGCSMLSCSS